MCWCVFFSLDSRAIIAERPKCSHSFVYYFTYAMVCAFYFSLCPCCVTGARAFARSLCVLFGPVAMASLIFCAYRVRTSTAKIYNTTVLLLRLLLPLLLLLSLPFEFTVFLFHSCSSCLPSSFAHHERPSHLRICEFFFFLSFIGVLRCIRFCLHLVSLCSFIWENGV